VSWQYLKIRRENSGRPTDGLHIASIRIVYRLCKHQHEVPKAVYSRILLTLQSDHEVIGMARSGNGWSDGAIWVQMLEAGESRSRKTTIFNLLEYMGAWEWFDRQVKLSETMVYTGNNTLVMSLTNFKACRPALTNLASLSGAWSTRLWPCMCCGQVSDVGGPSWDVIWSILPEAAIIERVVPSVMIDYLFQDPKNQEAARSRISPATAFVRRMIDSRDAPTPLRLATTIATTRGSLLLFIFPAQSRARTPSLIQCAQKSSYLIDSSINQSRAP
jgi:hypothetical protein